MIIRYNIEDEREIKKLTYSKRFTEYPNMFLSNICEVRVNPDDYLLKDNFILSCKLKILPRKIFIYGKKERYNSSDDLYLNYWMNIFFKTIEKGYLHKYNFEKCTSKSELCIGLPLEYRCHAFNYESWKKENIIDFLSCLFNTILEEGEYKQQDLWEELLVA